MVDMIRMDGGGWVCERDMVKVLVSHILWGSYWLVLLSLRYLRTGKSTWLNPIC